MKTYILLFSKLLLLVLIIANNLLAQSESSKVIGISPGDAQVTEPMIAVNPTDPNNFITVYSNWYEGIYRRPASSTTINNGIDWISTEVPNGLLKYPNDQADPSIAFDANGNAHYCYLDIGSIYRDISVAHSTNKGISWTDTSRAYDDFLQQIPGIPKPDKPWITADISDSPYKNTLYIVFTAIFGEGSSNPGYAIFLTYKRPNDNYFRKPIRVCETVYQSENKSVQGAFPVVGTDGTLYIFWALEQPYLTGGYGPASIYMRKSTNGGMSFTFTPVVIKSEISEPEGIISFQKAHSWPYVAVNPEDGSLNMVYGSGTNVLYSYSTDKGVTWSTSSNKGMNLPGSSTWNPNITCNSKGKLSIVYYSSGYKVLVATGYANDETFTIWSQGSFNFSTPFKYTDYIGIACNDFIYWAVWPAPSGTKSKIFGTHRTIFPVVENLDQDYLTFTNDKIIFDGSAYNSPYIPSNALLPGVLHTLQTYSNTLTKNGSTYNFYRWEDENGNLISTNSQVDVKIDNHRYRAMFAYVPPPPIQYVTVNIKNEFKDPNNTIHNGGTVNIDNEDYENTENLPGQQVTETYLKNSVHRFEAKEQIYPEGSYYRGFNPRSDYDGGWVYPDLITRRYESTIQPIVTNNNGTYLAKYRNRYNAYVNGSAPEDNGFVANIFPTKQIWQFESSQISAPTDQTFPSGLTGIFVNWLDGSQINPIIVIPTDNQTYTALYKYPHHSNSTSAYSSNSQRKFIQTPDGVKHICYESMGKVWYELSTDNGATWFLGNAGKPLSSVDSKNPSMSFYGNQVGIVWQEKDGNSFKIKMALFWMSDYSSSLFGTIAEDYGAYSLNANPVFAWGNNGKTVVVWSGNDLCANPFGSTALKYWYGSASSNGINLIQQCGISGTDENSTNPTIIADYTDNISNPFNYHLAWEQLINTSNSKVNYCRLFYQNNNLQQSAIEEASLNSGYNKNYKPLITLRKAFGSEYIYISWIGYRQFISQGAGLEKTNFEQTGETRALVRNCIGSAENGISG